MEALRYAGDPSERVRLLADSSRLLFEAGFGVDEIMQSLCRSCVESICDFAVIFSIAAGPKAGNNNRRAHVCTGRSELIGGTGNTSLMGASNGETTVMSREENRSRS